MKVAQSDLALELSQSKWTRMKFNKSGKQILVTTNSGLVIMVDGYTGSITHIFTSEGDHGKPSKLPAPACFSQDDNTVFCGNENGTISCFDATTGDLLKKLDGHVGRVGCISVNPNYAQLATSCTNTALWNLS